MTRPAQRLADFRIREDDFQATLIEYATVTGWLVAHFRAAMTTKGWRTPVAAGAAGFPDLVLVRERVVFAELKTTSGKVRPTQQRWLSALDTAKAEVYVWRPTDWYEITRALAPVPEPPGPSVWPAR